MRFWFYRDLSQLRDTQVSTLWKEWTDFHRVYMCIVFDWQRSETAHSLNW